MPGVAPSAKVGLSPLSIFLNRLSFEITGSSAPPNVEDRALECLRVANLRRGLESYQDDSPALDLCSKTGAFSIIPHVTKSEDFVNKCD